MLPVCFLTLSLVCSGDAAEINSLVEKLATVDQAERDVAAKRLREDFAPSPRKTWERLLNSLELGMTKEELLTKLSSEQRKSREDASAAGSRIETYRLDHAWQLWVWFRDDEALLETKLVPHIQQVWIAPPADFSGKWVTYFANGQPSHVIEYRAGQYHGKFTANHSDGSKSYVQHYGHDGADGEDTGYFPSGKVSYRAYYSKGKPVGVWTWYNEQGEVTSTRMH
jgi:hypothetical protein